jgi:hypothetical protein
MSKMVVEWIELFWWRFFCVELALCIITCVMWLLDPITYIRKSLGVSRDMANTCKPLLWEQANVVSCVYGILFAFILFSQPYHILERQRIMLWLATVMTIGDLGIIIIAVVSFNSAASRNIVAMKIGMATIFGTIRSQYVLANCEYL